MNDLCTTCWSTTTELVIRRARVEGRTERLPAASQNLAPYWDTVFPHLRSRNLRSATVALRRRSGILRESILGIPSSLHHGREIVAGPRHHADPWTYSVARVFTFWNSCFPVRKKKRERWTARSARGSKMEFARKWRPDISGLRTHLFHDVRSHCAQISLLTRCEDKGSFP